MATLRRPVLIALGLLGVAGCSDLTITRASDRITSAIASPSFGRDIAPVFRQTCASANACHGLPDGQYGLVLEGSDAAIYAKIVNVKSAQETTLMRIKPLVPDSSWLLMRLSDSTLLPGYPRMPLTALPLPLAVRQTIRNWIANGAPKN